MSRVKVPGEVRVLKVAVAGNPNSGKTTIFNALTGMRLKVGNYPGVTVERREGRMRMGGARQVVLVDLPGTYSLAARSVDERIARDVLLGWLAGEPRPDAVIVVLDASNLERNLYLASQILELNLPTVLVCNMMDLAEQKGAVPRIDRLEEIFGVPVVPTVGNRGRGVDQIPVALERALAEPASDRPRCPLPAEIERVLPAVERALLESGLADERSVRGAACLLLLHSESDEGDAGATLPEPVQRVVDEARAAIVREGLEDPIGTLIEARYEWLTDLLESAVDRLSAPSETLSDRLDRVLTHKVLGMLIFASLMLLMFASIFWLAEPVMGWIEAAVEWLQAAARQLLPRGVLADLVADGIIAGVGNVVVFFPQICMLFLFIAMLEDSGYMARAAFLMDKIMSRVGLHGKSFIPLISSFACAVPGILATRTIESRRDRLATILVAPLMSCSARLPVYLLLVALIFPRGDALAKTFVLAGMYGLGIVMALGMATLFKKTLLKGPAPAFVMELPPYRLPLPLPVLRMTWDRSKQFLVRAGTIILAASVLLWAMAYWPRSEEVQLQARQQIRQVLSSAGVDVAALGEGGGSVDLPADIAARIEEIRAEAAARQLANSVLGRLGRVIEPVIRPLGYDWRIGVAILASFAAREVFVSTMGIIYSAGDEEEISSLRQRMQMSRWPDGRPIYTRAACLGLMVFYVLAMQCVSTLAVAWRETGSWRWPAFMWAYMTGLAYFMAWIVYRIGVAVGWL